MQKETEEITTEAVGQRVSEWWQHWKESGSQTSFQNGKNTPKTLSVLSGLKLINLLKRERLVIFEDIFSNVTEIMDHKNDGNLQKTKRALTFSKKS